MKHLNRDELLTIIQKNVDNINKINNYKISNINYTITKNNTENNKLMLNVLKYINNIDDIIENGDILNISFDITQNFKGSYSNLKTINKTYNIDNIGENNSNILSENIKRILKDEIIKFNFEKNIQNKIHNINNSLEFIKNKKPYDLSRVSFKKNNDTYILYGNTQNNSRIELILFKDYVLSKDILNEMLTLDKINKLNNDTIKTLKHTINNSRSDNEVVISPNQSVRVVTNTTLIETDSGTTVNTNIEYNIENKTRSIEHNQVLGQDQPMFFDLNYIFMMNQIEIIKEESEIEYNDVMSEIESEYENDIKTRELENIQRDELDRISKIQQDKEDDERKKEEKNKQDDLFSVDTIEDFNGLDFI